MTCMCTGDTDHSEYCCFWNDDGETLKEFPDLLQNASYIWGLHAVGKQVTFISVWPMDLIIWIGEIV